jgi:hypothetical protein
MIIYWHPSVWTTLHRWYAQIYNLNYKFPTNAWHWIYWEHTLPRSYLKYSGQKSILWVLNLSIVFRPRCENVIDRFWRFKWELPLKINVVFHHWVWRFQFQYFNAGSSHTAGILTECEKFCFEQKTWIYRASQCSRSPRYGIAV